MLQRQKMGALIVFERSTKLGEIINSGTLVDADPTPELIGNIFFNKAPLHDGAMIMRDGRVYAAGCILPLTDNLQISRELGTRHRAGVGMSENSDAKRNELAEYIDSLAYEDGSNPIKFVDVAYDERGRTEIARANKPISEDEDGD